MIDDFKMLLEKYSVSEETGMAIFRGFDPSSLLAYGLRCKNERVSYDDAAIAAQKSGVEIVLDGQGVIGAVAALPFYGRPDESIIPGMG